MLMDKEDYDNKITGSDVNDEESMVELEGELISALEEIARLRFKKKKKKKLLIQFEKDSKKPDENFALLKVELEEAKKIEEILKQHLSEKKSRCEALEEEVVKTRKEMEKFKALYLQNLPIIKASTELNNIPSKHISPLLKIGLGYVSGSRSKQKENKEPIKMIKFQVNRQSDHVSTLPPKYNKDKMIPDKKQRYQNM
jgi:chromosome segregation ATPase